MIQRHIISLLILLAVMPLYAEYLFLSDGSIIRGSVVNETANEVVFKDVNKNVKKYRRDKVIRVLYAELNMGKVYVQMKNGKSLIAYIVDEDRDAHTLRNDITKPEEFRIKRSEVLFIAERNPSGLHANPGYTDIKLDWYPPFDKMKYFNIYVKKNKEDKYSVAGISGRNSYHIKGLNDNTKYFMYVTGVDQLGAETAPSNEIEISTANKSLSPPVGLRVTITDKGKAILSWEQAKDPSGIIKKYKVYSIKDKMRKIAGETKEAGFTLNDARDVDRAVVTSVDISGSESGGEDVRVCQAESARVSFMPGGIYPIDKLAEMGTVGYGGLVSYMLYDIFTTGLTAGVEGGYYYLQGSGTDVSERGWINRSHIVPLYSRIGYSMALSSHLSFTPSISIGAAFYELSYTKKDPLNLTNTEKTVNGIDPIATGLVSLDYIISYSFFIGVNAGYNAIIEKEGILQFASFGINLGMRL